MDKKKTYAIPSNFAKNAHIDKKGYQELYKHSIEDPEKFWGEQAHKFISWSKPWEAVTKGDFNSLDVNWFINGKLNACYNCVDRHLAKNKDKVAIIWEGNDPKNSKKITYNELYKQVCKFANVLKKLNIKKGDRVCIYLPMIPEAIIAILSCARIGAIHNVVFGGFSAEALKTRILDSDCRLLITADQGVRGEKTIPLKANCDLALETCPDVTHSIIIKHTGSKINWDKDRDRWYHEEMDSVNDICPIEEMDANDPLFILYTSGSTGKPKGILHSTGGYLLYVAMTHHYIFDYHQNDIFWCSADLGWITGHSYLVYGPLANGATTLLFEGVPNYPSFSRYWEIIDKHRVNIFYTSPTAIRALRREGDEWVTKTNRSSLKLLGTVGEPINPDAWEWYFNIVGEKRCPIVNTWWQTETGGILLSEFPGATPLMPGSVGWPFFGIAPEIVDTQGNTVKDNEQGRLIIKKPWPGCMQTIYGNHDRFINAYFRDVPGNYLTGDVAYVTQEKNYWIIGRSDDVIKVSGHRISTEEIESALVSHPGISEAAVIGIPHEIKGESIYAFVTPMININTNDSLKAELIQHVRTKIGPLATPDHIQWAPALPKTRSGKIMRRILRKIASNDLDDLGDTSTLADPNIIDQLIKDKK